MGYMGDWFDDYMGAWFGEASGTPPEEPVYILPPMAEDDEQAQATEQAQAAPATRTSGKLITVTDAGRYLPANPDEWPDQLKREIRDCCCGASTSPGPILASYPSCCNVLFPSEMRGNIRNSDTHDTALRFRYWPAFSAYSNRFGTDPTRPLENVPPWIDRRMLPSVPNDYAILGGFNSPPISIPYLAGWWSDVIFDFERTYTASGTISSPGNPFAGIPPTTFNFSATWTTKVYYYAFFPQTQDFGCRFEVYQCAFPEGTLTCTQSGLVGIPATETFPITWLNNAGIGLLFTQRYPNDGNDNPLLGGYGPGGWLTFDPNVKSSVIASWSAGATGGCSLIDCNNKTVKANPVYFQVGGGNGGGIFSFGSLYNEAPLVNIPSQRFPVGFSQTFNIDDYDEGVLGCGGLNNPGYQDNKTLVEIFP